MLKEKIMKLLKDAKELVIRRKKEVAIAAAGAVVLGGIGFGVYYATSDNTSNEIVEGTVVTDDSVADSEGVEDSAVVDSSSEEGTVETTSEEGVATEENATITEGTATENKEEDTVVANGSTTEENKEEVSKEENTGSTSSSKPNNGGSSSKPSTGGTSKPSTGGSSSSSNTSKPSGGTTSKPSGGTTSKPSHTHNWVAQTKTIHHKEQGHYENVLVKPAWTEEVPIYEEQERSICNGCRKDITADPYKHMEDALIAGNTKCGGFHSEWKKVQVGTKKVHHKAEYKKKWVVDKKAWTETVVTGHKCSGCGATK